MTNLSEKLVQGIKKKIQNRHEFERMNVELESRVSSRYQINLDMLNRYCRDPKLREYFHEVGPMRIINLAHACTEWRYAVLTECGVCVEIDHPYPLNTRIQSIKTDHHNFRGLRYKLSEFDEGKLMGVLNHKLADGPETYESLYV